MTPRTLQTPWGMVNLTLETDQLLKITGESDNAVFYGQGYGAGYLRLWQLDLSRRVADGRLSEVMGNATLATDKFQRRLGLIELAKRAEYEDKTAEPNSWQATQHQHIQAYVAGINHAIRDLKIRPVECLLLRYHPKEFTTQDSYLLAQLKYFINSAWQYAQFNTQLANQLTATQHQQLLSTFSIENHVIPPFPLNDKGEYLAEVVEAFKDGLKGLQYLGLDSPDTGSNVMAVSGDFTKSGYPLLAADPHMGHVNPSFNILCHLESDEGLNVTGSHFPGAPGIIVGRNVHTAWGQVGIMANNQDLYWGRIDLENEKVETVNGWQPLIKRTHEIGVGTNHHQTFITYDYSQGQLMAEKEGYGLFLRWPALDNPSGDITFYKLAKCHDWASFREALRHVKNSPMIVGYADIHGDIGLQSMGYIPKRPIELGSLVLSLTEPNHQWQGYVPYDDLPMEYNPECGYVFYANQYSELLFNGKTALSNRWHPPTRALRIKALLTQTKQHNFKTFTAMQDDKVDVFAQKALAFLLPYVPEDKVLFQWNGDTQQVAASRLFDVWIQHISEKLLGNVLNTTLLARYSDFWPSCRWNVLNILQYHASDWQHNENDIAAIIRETYNSAVIGSQKMSQPYVEFKHSLKKPRWLNRLLTGRYVYQGGNRETIHATRQTADFLTASQAGKQETIKTRPYTFGPGYKLIASLDPLGECQYLINTPAKGNPFYWKLNKTLKCWQTGQRQSVFLPLNLNIQSDDQKE